MKMKWKLSLLFLAMNFISISAFGIEPSWSYRVLVSDHFELIFRKDQLALAKRYLVAAEHAYELLIPIFKEGPAKTIIVLRDDTDSANGLADFLPYPHIVIYPVLPTQTDSIDEYGDWPLEIMIHEYTHILNIYPAHGIYWPFKYILGTVVRPNGILPRWYLEGLAVNLESRLTEFGRLRSPDTQAVARALVLGDAFSKENIATVNESDTKNYPYGTRPYLYGGWWWDEMHRRKGEESIYTLNQNFSRRLPFLLNGPIHEQSGFSTNDLLRAATNTQADLAHKQIAAIQSTSPVAADTLLQRDGDAIMFSVSPSGMRLVYWLGLIDEGSFAFVRTRERLDQSFKDAPEKKLFRTIETQRVSWVNDDQFVFDQIDALKPHVQFRDLYLYNLTSGQIERLTNGARAQDPAVSPDGTSIAFVQNTGGQTSLAQLDIAKTSIRTLVKGSLRVRIASPVFLNNKQLLFTVRSLAGDEKIFVYDFTTQKSKVWTDALKSAQTLRRTAGGLVATDARTGVRNAYQIKGTQVTPVTNTLTGIFAAEIDPNSKNLIVSELTPKGPRLKFQPLKAEQPPMVPKPNLDPPLSPDTTKVKFKNKNFWPITYMAPRYWIPAIYTVEDGIIVQGTTSVKDPLERNVYDLFGSYDSVTNKGSYGLSYLNSSLPADIGLGYGKFVTYLGASGRLIESKDASLSLRGPLGSRLRTWALNGTWSDIDGQFSSYRRVGPGATLAYSGLNSPYNDHVGIHAEVRHQEFLPQDGYTSYARSYAYFASVFSLERHKLGLQVRGALAPKMPFSTVIDLGDRNVGGNYLVSLANSEFLMRGYPSGTFVGRKVINSNLEWALPAIQLTRGLGTFPLFLRELEFAFFSDAIAVDGGAFNDRALSYIRSHMGEFYTGAGAEARLMTTMAYHIPVSLTLGLYYGFKDEYGGGFNPFMAIGLGSLSPISKKTP